MNEWERRARSRSLEPAATPPVGREGLPKKVALLNAIVEKKATSLEKWAAQHRFGRTTIFDWKAALVADRSLKGRVSDQKVAAIEKAIEDDAQALGLGARTRSH